MEDVYTPNSLGEEFPNTQECSQSSSQNGRSVTQSQWWLVSMNSNKWNKEVPENGELVMGRGVGCDVNINDCHISKRHCRIIGVNGSFSIEDHSSNGTFVNRENIGRYGIHALQHGDEISLSKKVSFVFVDKLHNPSKNASYFGEEISSLYYIKEELGCGNTSVVRRGIDKKTGKSVAIKVIKKGFQSTSNEQLMREALILKRIDHPNIIKYENIIISEHFIFIVLEFAKGGDLFDKIGKLSEVENMHVFKQLISAIEYLHAHGIVHRDLKPENVLLDTCLTAKLSDFGLARIANSSMNTLCGTPIYLAPEIIKLGSKETTDGYSSAVDIWSLGVMLYLMLSGNLPFTEEPRRQMSLYEQIETGTFDFDDPKWKLISNQAIDLVKRLLVVDPKDRITAQEALKHPWFMNSVP